MLRPPGTVEPGEIGVKRAMAVLDIKIAVAFVRIVVDYCRSQGLGEAALLKAAGLADDTLSDPDSWLSLMDFLRLFQTGMDLLQDENFGLHVGQHIKPGYYGVQGYAVISSANGREALVRAQRYYRLVSGVGQMDIEEREDEVVLLWRSNLPGNPYPGRQQAEMVITAWVSLARWAAGLDLAPSWVSFRHPAPADSQEQQAVFRCPLIFAAQEYALGFPKALLDVPFLQADPAIQQIMDATAERRLAELDKSEEPLWLSECRRAVARALTQGTPLLEDVAPGLGMTPRELRGRLAALDTSFKALLDETRRTLALSLMQDASMSLVDVSFLLGFSEQSAFQRAFKRWTGRSPGQYRQELI